MSRRFKFVRETDSTNELMKELLWTSDLPEGFVLRTDFQTRGKGQGTNRWESVKGKNLLFSILLRPEHVPVEEQFLISQIVSLAICDTLKSLSSSEAKEFSVKWPNDIYWKNKKIAGILIENTWQGRRIANSVIGVGLNVNQKQFLSGAPNPVSLFQIFGKRFRRKAILKTILALINTYCFDPDEDSLRMKYYQSLFRKDGFYTYRSGRITFEAEIVDVEKDGKLMLREMDGKVSGYYFKEVEFVL